MQLTDDNIVSMSVALVTESVRAQDEAWLGPQARERQQQAAVLLLTLPLTGDVDDVTFNASRLLGVVAELAATALQQLRTNVPGFDVETWLQQIQPAPEKGATA